MCQGQTKDRNLSMHRRGQHLYTLESATISNSKLRRSEMINIQTYNHMSAYRLRV